MVNLLKESTQLEIINTKYQIETSKKMNGKKSIFTHKIMDTTEQIEKLQAKLKRLEKSY